MARESERPNEPTNAEQGVSLDSTDSRCSSHTTAESSGRPILQREFTIP